MSRRGRASRVARLMCGAALMTRSPLALAAPFVLASEDEASRALAQTLFDDGVRLMEAGQCDDEHLLPDRRPTCRDALDRFRRAFAVYPGALGALRNAAFCERALGLVASAMRDFREVARRAPLDENPSKQLWATHAADEAERLSKRVPRTTIVVETPPSALKVTLDGQPIQGAAFGVPLPVDPGDHTLRASAPGFVDYQRYFDIEEREDLTLRIDLSLPPPPPPPPRRAPLRVAPILVLGAGVIVTGVGLGFGWLAKKRRDDACDTSTSPTVCQDSSGLDRARSYALASTITTASGVAIALAGAGWLVFGGRRAHDTHGAVRIAPSVGWGSAGVTLAGSF